MPDALHLPHSLCPFRDVDKMSRPPASSHSFPQIAHLHCRTLNCEPDAEVVLNDHRFNNGAYIIS